MDINDYFKNPDKLTNLQKESFELTTALEALHTLARNTADLDLFIAKVFGRHVASNNDNPKGYLEQVPPTFEAVGNDKNKGTLFFQDKILPMLAKSFTGQLRAKMNRVVGVALSNARPGETLDVLIRPSY
jgi:hypothetical protein